MTASPFTSAPFTSAPFDLDMGLLPLSSFAPYAPYALLTPPPVQRWLDTLYSAQTLTSMLANPMSSPHTSYRRPFETSPDPIAAASQNADEVAFPPDLQPMLACMSTVMSTVLNVAAQQELMLFQRWLAVQQALFLGGAAVRETADPKSSPTKARTTKKHK
jgi:hypothetical protein